MRHLRKLDICGRDVSFARLAGHLHQRGPPCAIELRICAIPCFGLIVFLVIAWRRTGL
jgi:hypothetical protein